MTKYKYILFDADGTLFDYHRAESESLRKTFEHYGIEDKDSEISALYNKINHKCWSMFEKKQLTLDQLRVKRFSELIEEGRLGSIDPLEMGEKYLGYLAAAADMIEGAPELLEKLYGNYSLVMITNGISEIQHSRIKEADIGKYFDAVIISDEVGFQKPASEYFDITMEKIGNPDKSEVIIIGDSLTSDIAGGNRYGIDTCWINIKNSEPVCPYNTKIKAGKEGLSDDFTPDYEVNNLFQIIEIVS